MEKINSYDYWTFNHVLGYLHITLFIMGILWALVQQKPTNKSDSDYEDQLSKYWQRKAWVFLFPAYVGVILSTYFLLTDTYFFQIPKQLWFLEFEKEHYVLTPFVLTLLTWLLLAKPIRSYIKEFTPIDVGLYLLFGKVLCGLHEGLFVVIPRWVKIVKFTTTLRQQESPSDIVGGKQLSMSTGEMAKFFIDPTTGTGEVIVSKQKEISDDEQGVLETIINLVGSVRISFQITEEKTKMLFRKFGDYFRQAEKENPGTGEAAMVKEIFNQLFDEAYSAAEAYGPRHTSKELMVNQDGLNKAMRDAVVLLANDWINIGSVSIVEIGYDPKVQKALDDYTAKILATNEDMYKKLKDLELYNKKTEALVQRVKDLKVSGSEVLNQETSLGVAEKVTTLNVVSTAVDLSGMFQAAIAKQLTTGGSDGK